MQGPAVREASLDFSAQDATAVVDGVQSADGEFRALFIVQPEARGNKYVILEGIGCPLASFVVSPFGDQAQIGVRLPQGVDRVFTARDDSRVVFFLVFAA